MASNSGIPVSHSQLLPTQQNLSELLVKLLTVFGIESVLDGEVLPRQPLQREIGKNLRPALRPMVGNDFHIQTAFGTDHSWKALLQLDQGDDSTKISLPLCHVAQHPGTDDAAAAIRLVEHMAKLLRYTWPDANVGALSKRRQLGPPFVDSDGTDYHLFRWLASKDLNPVSEGVFLRNLYQSVDLLYQPLRQKSRGLTIKPSPEADRECISVQSGHDNGQVPLGEHDAQIWSFTGSDQWVISLPVVATILLLMAHPTKGDNPLADNPDRDLSWTLDSLHGFCRKEDLEDGNRHLSWSLGTYPDNWMYLNFIFHYFTPQDVDAEGMIGNGMRCDRRTITVPLGGSEGKETFREQRVWFSMRTATAYSASQYFDVEPVKGPATIGCILADAYHHPIRMTKKDWAMCGMESVRGAAGVTAFQMLLWGGVDEWSEHWNGCLNYIDRLYQVKVEDIDDSNPEKLHNLMFDPQGSLAKEYFVTAHLLKVFRQHIDVLPRTLQQMGRKWERTYPGMESDLAQRFGEVYQETLLNNWTRLIDHAKELHGKLADRIEKRSAELLRLRDSLMVAKSALCAENSAEYELDWASIN